MSILPIAGFVILAVMLNIWKPIFVSRFYEFADKKTAATTLSVSNQSKTLSVAVLAPLMGWFVDKIASSGSPIQILWPVAALGIVFSILGIIVHHMPSESDGALN
jgi:hypothetical protein